MAHESIYFSLCRVSGKHDVKDIKKGLDTLPGVMSVSVNANSGSVAVDIDDTGTDWRHVQEKLEELGFAIEDTRADTLTE